MEHTAANQLTSFYLKQRTERGFCAAQRVKLPSCRSHEPLVREHPIPPQSLRARSLRLGVHYLLLLLKVGKMKLHSQMVEEAKDCISFSSFKRRGKMKWESLNNKGITLTISITAEGFPGPHDPEDCVEMSSSLVSHGQSSKLNKLVAIWVKGRVMFRLVM